jgi:hypothetical protein
MFHAQGENSVVAELLSTLKALDKELTRRVLFYFVFFYLFTS